MGYANDFWLLMDFLVFFGQKIRFEVEFVIVDEISRENPCESRISGLDPSVYYAFDVIQ